MKNTRMRAHRARKMMERMRMWSLRWWKMRWRVRARRTEGVGKGRKGRRWLHVMMVRMVWMCRIL